jgi:carbon-monoxide dehydrogenase large subunit
MSPDTTPAALGGNVGAARPRLHDPRLLKGHGRYVDDIDDRGALHAAILRSPVPHGRISGFDGSAALAAGAVLVLGPDDIEGLVEPLPTKWRLPGQQPDAVAVADRTVRYVGQPIGIVIAASRAAAEDMAELVKVEIDELPAVTSVDAALADGASLLYPESGTNVAGEIHFGTPVDALEATIGSAPHVIERVLAIQRVAHSPMEPRGVLAEWVPTIEQLTVWMSSQAPQAARLDLSTSLRLRVDQVRVVAPDVGGAFGGKTVLYVDEALVCLAAKILGCRVKWIEDRTENLVSSYQGRGLRAQARLAVGADGRFLAIQAHITGDLGAFATQAGSGPFQVAALALEGPYRFGAAGASVTGVYTNAVPTGAYRGYGMQEAAWIRERLIDEAARELGLDSLQIRLLNVVQSTELPHTTHTYLTYDSGDYAQALRRAGEIARQRTRPSTDRTRRGVGLASSVEITGFAPSALLEMFRIDWSGWESGRIRINQDGSITVFSGVISIGQGIETALAQIVADRLDVPIDWISVQLGDTSTASHSDLTSQASRSVALAGGALVQAGDRLRRRMRGLAARHFDVPVEDVIWDGANFSTAGADASASWRHIAHRGWMGWGRSEPDRIQLEEVVDFDPPAITYAYSTHGAAVAVDLDTGKVTVEDYWSVNDSGVLVNPLLADGQIIGGIVQGLGIALLEESRYDADTGQPLSTTWGDYLLPVSADVPRIQVEHMCTPSDIIPGGFKGLGEGGIIATPAAIANAVAAAVPDIAAKLTSTPLSPERIWTALNAAGPSSRWAEV